MELALLLGTLVWWAVFLNASVGIGFLAGLLYGKIYYTPNPGRIAHDPVRVDISAGGRTFASIVFSVYNIGWIRRSPLLKWMHWCFSFEVCDTKGRSLIRGGESTMSQLLRGAVQSEREPQHYLLAMHPHGLFATSTGLAFLLPYRSLFGKADGALPTMFVHRLIFYIPLLREIALALGCRPADRDAMVEHLRSQEALDAAEGADAYSVIVPGGIKEMVEPDLYDKMDSPEIGWKLTGTQNWGFLRVAYETGRPVVPCYCENERHLFYVLDYGPIRPLRIWMSRFMSYPLPTFFLGPLLKKKLTVVVGNPVYPPQYDAGNSARDIETFKARYFDMLASVRARAREMESMRGSEKKDQ